MEGDEDDLKNVIIEEALMFLEENMSIDTDPPTKAPGMFDIVSVTIE